jgi:hypothetical protein
MHHGTETVEALASLMISARPAWMLPWLIGLSIVGVVVTVSLVCGLFTAAVLKLAGGAK